MHNQDETPLRKPGSRRGGAAALACAFALLLATTALAQEQRASIVGTVTDTSGGVLPGVTVEARSTGGAVVTATTDASGGYRFAALAPGTYEVTATLAGFRSQRVDNVQIAVSQIRKLDLALAVGGVAEAVQVTAESPIIEVTQSEKATHIRDEFIENLPKGRDFSTLLIQAPGANAESRFAGRISIDGSSAGENRFFVDGVDTTQMVNGTQGKKVVTDFLDEVEVRSSGYTAEFGGSTGAVVNVVGKSGSNAFHGDGGFYFSGDSLTSSRRPTLRLNLNNSELGEFVTFPEDDETQVEPGVTIGGPIVKNRLWFFGGYQPELIDRERTVTLTANGETVSRGQDVTTHNITANVRSQIKNNLTGRLAFNMSSARREGLLPDLSGTDAPGTLYDIDQKTPNRTFSGHLDYVATPKLFLGIRGGYFFSDIKDQGVPQAPLVSFQTSNIGQAGVPAQFQRSTGFRTLSTNNETRRDELTRLNFQGDATYYADFGGKHTFKGGVQVDRIGNDVNSGETGHRTLVFWNRSVGGQRGTFGYYRIRSNGLRPELGFLRQGDINQNNIGLFIQDAWAVNDRLTLNVGLRSENEHIPSFTTEGGIASTAIKFNFSDKLAPRLGAAYDVLGDGRWKAYGSWGLYYDITKLELPRGSFGGEHWLEYWFALDTADFNSLNPAGCPPACPGRLLRGPTNFRTPSNSPGDETIDPGIDAMKLQEAVVGLDHQLTPNMAVGARYVHKQIDRAVEDIGFLDAAGNEIFKIGNPGFGQSREFLPDGGTSVIPQPKAVRDYDGVEVSLNKSLSKHWALRTSYLWSRLHGNFSGLSQSDENGRLSPNVGRSFDAPIMSFNAEGEPVFGALATDRPHQFKAHFIYSLPFGTTAGVSQFASSGVPVTREAAFVLGSNFPVMYLGRKSDGRTENFTQTDLVLMHEFDLGAGHGLQVSFNILNLFDQDTVTEKFRTQLAPGASIDVTEAEFFDGVDTRALISQQTLPQDPRFLQPSGFQAPREMRLGVRWRF